MVTQHNQLTITSNKQMVYADVQDRNEAASVRKSSGAFSQLQQSLEIKVDKQRDGEYRRLSAEARPFLFFRESQTISMKRNRKSQPNRRLRSTITIDLLDDLAYKRKRSCHQLHGLII